METASADEGHACAYPEPAHAPAVGRVQFDGQRGGRDKRHRGGGAHRRVARARRAREDGAVGDKSDEAGRRERRAQRLRVLDALDVRAQRGRGVRARQQRGGHVARQRVDEHGGGEVAQRRTPARGQADREARLDGAVGVEAHRRALEDVLTWRVDRQVAALGAGPAGAARARVAARGGDGGSKGARNEVAKRDRAAARAVEGRVKGSNGGGDYDPRAARRRVGVALHGVNIKREGRRTAKLPGAGEVLDCDFGLVSGEWLLVGWFVG